MKNLLAEYLRKILNEDDQNNPEIPYVDDDGMQRKARAETLRKYDPSHPGRKAYERWKQTVQATPADDAQSQASQATPEEPSTDVPKLPDELKDTLLQYSDEGAVKQATAEELANAPEGSGARKRYDRFVDGATFQQNNTEFQQFLQDTLEKIKNTSGRGNEFTFSDYKDKTRSRTATDKKIAQDGVAHQGYLEFVKALYSAWEQRGKEPSEDEPTTQEPTEEPTEEPKVEPKGRRGIVDSDGKVRIGTKRAKDPKSQASKLITVINSGDEQAIRKAITRMRLAVNKNGKLYSYATRDKVFGGESEAEKMYTHAVVTLLRDKYGIKVEGSENLVNPEDPATPSSRVMPSAVYKDATPVSASIVDGGRAVEIDGIKMAVVPTPNVRGITAELRKRNPDLPAEEAHNRAKLIVERIETYNARVRFLQAQLRDGAEFVSVGSGRDAVQTISSRLKESISQSQQLNQEQVRILTEQIDALSSAENVEELGTRWESVRKTMLTIPFMRESKVFPYFCEHVEGMRAALKDRKVIFPSRGNFKLGDVVSLSGQAVSGLKDMRQILDAVHIMDIAVDITGVKEREGAPSTMGTRIETGNFSDPVVKDILRTLCGNGTKETQGSAQRLFAAETPEELGNVRDEITSAVMTRIGDIRTYFKISNEISDEEIVEGLSRGNPPKYDETGNFAGFGEDNKKLSRAKNNINEEQMRLYSLSGYAFDAIYASNLQTQSVGLVSFGVSSIVEADGMSRLDRSEFNFDFALRVRNDGQVVAESYRSRVLAADVEGLRQISSTQKIQREIIVETKMRTKRLMLEFINRILSEQDILDTKLTYVDKNGREQEVKARTVQKSGESHPAWPQLQQLLGTQQPSGTQDQEPALTTTPAERDGDSSEDVAAVKTITAAANSIGSKGNAPAKRELAQKIANALKLLLDGSPESLAQLIETHGIVISPQGKLKATIGFVGRDAQKIFGNNKAIAVLISDIARRNGVPIPIQPAKAPKTKRDNFSPTAITASDEFTEVESQATEKGFSVNGNSYGLISTDADTKQNLVEIGTNLANEIYMGKGLSQTDAEKKAQESIEAVGAHNKRVKYISSQIARGTRFRQLPAGAAGKRILLDKMLKMINSNSELEGAQQDKIAEILGFLATEATPSAFDAKWTELRIQLEDDSTLLPAIPYICEVIEILRKANTDNTVLIPITPSFRVADVLTLGTPITDINLDNLEELVDNIELVSVQVDMYSVKSLSGAAAVIESRIELTVYDSEERGSDLLELGSTDSHTRLWASKTEKELAQYTDRQFDILKKYLPDILSYYRLPEDTTFENLFLILSTGNAPKYDSNGNYIEPSRESKIFDRDMSDHNRRQLRIYSFIGFASDAIEGKGVRRQAFKNTTFTETSINETDGVTTFAKPRFQFNKNIKQRPDGTVRDDGFAARLKKVPASEMGTY